MSVSLRNAWRDALRDSELDGTAKLVGYTLATYMDAAGTCWPSKVTLAERSSTAHIRTIDRAVKRLEDAGFIVVRRAPPSHNVYAARLPNPGAAAGVEGHRNPGAAAGVRGRHPGANPGTGVMLTPAVGTDEPDREPVNRKPFVVQGEAAAVERVPKGSQSNPGEYVDDRPPREAPEVVKARLEELKKMAGADDIPWGDA